MPVIALVSYEYPPDTGKGGIGTYTQHTAKILQKAGWEVEVFAGSPCRSETEEEDNVLVHRVQCADPHTFRTAILPIFRQRHALHAFDLVESPEIHANAAAIKHAFPQLPLIVRLHAPNYLVESLKKIHTPFWIKLRYVLGALRRGKWDLGFWRPYDWQNDPDYQFVQLADVVTAPSEAMKDWAVKNWKMPKQRIQVFPNPFTISSQPSTPDKTFKRIVFFGRLNVLKGLVPLTLAMRKLLHRHPDWQWRIIGDDGASHVLGLSMKQWMEKQLQGLEAQVEWLPGLPHEELLAKLNDCDIAVLPSYFESFSYTCVEAMASGLAVVGSNRGGMVDLLKNDAGLLVDPFNEKELTKELINLVMSPSKLSILKKRAVDAIHELIHLETPSFYEVMLISSLKYKKINLPSNHNQNESSKFNSQ